MGWNETNDAFIWIFRVGRGLAAFIRTPLNHGIIVDMARGEDFVPSEFILKYLCPHLETYKKNKIAQAILSHPHHDHISDCAALSEISGLYPTLITCPNDNVPSTSDLLYDPVAWNRIKNRDGNKSIEKYKKLYEGRTLPLQTIEHVSKYRMTLPLEYGIYYLSPKTCNELHSDDNEYGNSLSIMTYFRYGSQSILFPGDITPEAMERVLAESLGVEKRFTVFSRSEQEQHPRWITETFDQPSLKGRLKEFGLSVLVAPHHGLESCYSSELYSSIRGGKPEVVVVSEMYSIPDGQGKTHHYYQSENGASGLNVNTSGSTDFRRSVSTKSNHILIRMNGNGKPKIFCEKEIENLMKWANS